MTEHPWKLVSPWYRIDSVGGVDRNRNTAPIFQKYAAGDFTERLVAEPQQSLRFNSEDFVQRITPDPNEVITKAIRNKNPQPLKLFLDIHSRFYTVHTELHCDLPGFPNASPEAVCEAGFVVRRRVPIIPPEAVEQVSQNRIQYRKLKRQQKKYELAEAEAQKKSPGSVKTSAQKSESAGQVLQEKKSEVLSVFNSARAKQIQTRLEAIEDEFRELSVTHNIVLQLEGWVASDLQGIGSWQAVDDASSDLIEDPFPMYPLVADPENEQHSAKGRAQWFGVVPTASSHTDASGQPRFEDNVLYEVRCFVRRHQEHCPKKMNTRDCSGELVWSQATEPYQLASAFDVDGNSHRHISMKLPDFQALRDQVDAGPPGRGANVRAITPPGSGMNFKSKGMEMPEKATADENGDVCFHFSLIFFIVAYFLFQLFLPIVMFILQLWWMLKLKFCIPPSLSIDAGLALDLKLEGELSANIDAGIELEIAGSVKTYTDAGVLKGAIADELTEGLNLAGDFKDEFAGALGTDPAMSLDDVGDFFIDLATEFSDEAENPELAGEILNPLNGLVYFNKVMQA